MKRRRFIISSSLFVAAMALSGLGQARKSTFIPKSTPQARPEKVRDPVCGLMVEKDPELSTLYKGKTYYFCSKADRDKFKKNPDKWVKGQLKLNG